MDLEGGRTDFFKKEEAIIAVDDKLKNELSNVKNAIYKRIVIGLMPNDSKASQKTDNAIYYEHIMRRLCIDLDPTIRTSNMVPFDELPQTNKLIRELKNDKEIGPLIESLIKTYRALSNSENATYNSKYIQESLLIFPWPYNTDEEL